MSGGRMFRFGFLLTLLLSIGLVNLMAVQQDKRELAQTKREPRPTLNSARAEIEDLIHKSGAEMVAVAVCDLKTNNQLLINEHTSFHAASTMKVPVMMELFAQAAAGQFRLNDSLPVHNEFHSIVDNSPFQLDAKSGRDA